MKRIKNIILCIMLVMSFIFVMPANLNAAGGEIRFSDPSTNPNKNVDVLLQVFVPGTNLNGGEIEIKYDPEMIKFVEGDASDEGNGIIKCNILNGTFAEASFNLTFKSLKPGETDLIVNSYYVPASNGQLIDFVCGTSHITSVDDGSTVSEDVEKSDKEVTVKGEKYKIVDNFVDQVIPPTFERGTALIEGENHGVCKQETGEAVLVYLSKDGEGDFYYYSAADKSFSLVKSVEILPEKYILLLDSVEGVKLPRKYKKVKFTCGGKKMDGWQNNDMPGFTIVRAIDNSGLPTLYKMDSQDGTFQRFTVPTEKKEKKLGGVVGSILAYSEKNIEKVIVGLWSFFTLIVIIVVVLACKLKNRNAEILDLYDEFGVFEKDNSSRKKKNNKKKNSNIKEHPRKEKKHEKVKQDKDEELEPFFDSIDLDQVMPGHFDDFEGIDQDLDLKNDDDDIEIMRLD